MGRLTVRSKVTTIDLGKDPARRGRTDTLIAEEPLELRVNGTAVAVTMRTPGSDIEWLHGFLLTEGVITDRSQVAAARYCDGAVTDAETGTPRNTYNVVDVTLAPGVAAPDDTVSRQFYTTSSCGTCGKASIDAIRTRQQWPTDTDDTRWPAELLMRLPERLREQQQAFERTGALHAAGLFGADGEALVVREDVGRHNAVDKVLGWALLQDRLPATGTALVVSGRAAFELTQKAAMAGVSTMVAVSAPSSLAVAFAGEAGMTLCGFVRHPRMNVYAGAERIS